MSPYGGTCTQKPDVKILRILILKKKKYLWRKFAFTIVLRAVLLNTKSALQRQLGGIWGIL